MSLATLVPINEVFWAIQGEGDSSGMPSIFVRTQGCNLCCSWCDTAHSQADGDIKWTVGQLADKVGRLLHEHPASRVVFTGGEPMLHFAALMEVAETLGLDRSMVQWETNGTIDPEDYILGHVCASPKLAGAGGKMAVPTNALYLDHLVGLMKSLTHTTEVKFVLATPQDEEDALTVLGLLYERGAMPEYVTFQCEGGGIEGLEPLALRMQERKEYRRLWSANPFTKFRFLPQLHKIGGWR